MSRYMLLAGREDGASERFVLDVFEEGPHWTSTLARLDENGEPQEARVAPRFYGLSEEQAHRRMLSVLENQYDSVQVVRES